MGPQTLEENNKTLIHMICAVFNAQKNGEDLSPENFKPENLSREAMTERVALLSSENNIRQKATDKAEDGEFFNAFLELNDAKSGPRKEAATYYLTTMFRQMYVDFCRQQNIDVNSDASVTTALGEIDGILS